MGYIGNDSVTQNFTPAVDYFNGNGSTTSFTLSRTVGSAFDVQAFIENVPQNPSSAFTVAGNVITFTSAPPSGTNNIYVRYTSPVVQQVKPAPGTVSPTEINSAYSLWNLSGSDINYTAGNVGIGTASPTGKLNVVQNGTPIIGQFTRTDAGQGLVIAADSSGPYFRPTASGAVRFNNSANSVEYMRIDSSGNVGIGTSSPAAPLDIQSDTGAAAINIRGRASGDISSISFYNNANSTQQFYIQSRSAYTMLNTVVNSYMAFATNNTEVVRMPSTGGLRVACENFANQPSSSNWGIELNNTSASSVFFGQGTGTETHINFGNRNGIRGSIQTTSGGTSYNTTSDYRLKENIAPMTGALNKVAQLNPVTYNWKIGGNGQGFIAHELQEVVPEAVTGEKDAVDENGEPKYQMVDTSFLVATLTAAIQEQQAIIEDLKARIEILEAK